MLVETSLELTALEETSNESEGGFRWFPFSCVYSIRLSNCYHQELESFPARCCSPSSSLVTPALCNPPSPVESPKCWRMFSQVDFLI